MSDEAVVLRAASEARAALLEELGATLAGKHRTPRQLLLYQALCSSPRRAEAVRILVDDAIGEMLHQLDEATGGEATLLEDYLSRFPAEDVDPYLAIYEPGLQKLIKASRDLGLRRATAACLRLLTSARGATSTRTAVIELLEQGGGSRGERRALTRQLEAEQRPVLNAVGDAELKKRDVIDAFILALDERAGESLTRAAFRVVASGVASVERVAQTIEASLGQNPG